jgi:endonuclease/exonuclease/phosphatase family metal-dependent hydrolase
MGALRLLRLASFALLALGGCRERGVQPAPSEAAHPAPSLRAAAPRAGPRRPKRTPPDPLPPNSIWRSREACLSSLAAGKRTARGAGSARIGSWNVRWFPDGRPGRRAPKDGGTDVDWLACAIAWLDLDALAVQEFKAHERARDKARELTDRLDRLTGGRWKLELDGCRGSDAGQHVGILWNSARVTARAPLLLPSLNPHGEACKDQLRPGLAAYLTFPGGLDLHLVSVHFKSGPERRSIDLRRRSFDGLTAAWSALQAAHADSDVVIAGDFNTMGCRHCSPPISAEEELAETARLLSAAGLDRVEATVPCTHLSSHGDVLLDQFAVGKGTRELAPDSRASVSGVCGETACEAGGSSSASAALSDHCPVVLELTDRDLD